jgi:hypothetical protein
VIERISPTFLYFVFNKSFNTSQDPYGMFTVTFTGGAEFVQDSRFLFTRNFCIT